MATADNIEGPYEFQKILVSSGFTRLTAEKTNIYEVLGEDANISGYLEGGDYNNLKYPNCIDPALFHSADGKLYMVYGSWSGGIFIYEMDETTGLPIYPSKEEADRNTLFRSALSHIITFLSHMESLPMRAATR